MQSNLLIKLTDIVHGPTGYDWLRQRELDPTLPAYSVAGWADGFLSAAIQCLLIGMEAEGQELLAKSDQWMTAALQRTNAGESVVDEAGCYFDLALCRWLEGPPTVPPNLTRAYHLLDTNTTANPSRAAVEEALPLWLDAGRVQDCVAAFEQFEPRYSWTRQRRHSSGALAYLLAGQRLKHTLSGTELDRLIEDFLTQQVPEMLSNGWYRDYARWVKRITEAEPGPKARVSIRIIAEKYT